MCQQLSCGRKRIADSRTDIAVGFGAHAMHEAVGAGDEQIAERADEQ